MARARQWVARAGLYPGMRLQSLPGDASDRRFIRAQPTDGRSRVLVVHVDPIDPATLPLVRVAELFTALGVPVPEVLATAADLGIVVLEDLGDTTLEDALASASAAVRAARYEEAVGLIAVIQRGGRRPVSTDYPAFRLAFDVATLTSELGFFVEHFLIGHRGCAISPAVQSVLDAEFLTLAREMTAEPLVLCHRDFHARNLMMHDGHLHVIDFQDARMGPDTYDLSSLLRDAYVEIDAQLVDHLINHYRRLMDVPDGDEFRHRFDRTALQRNLKALGTFGYQVSVRGKTRYRDAVPRTLSYVRDTTRRDPRYNRLHDVLADLLVELRS